jgi:hypothetical protein
MFNLPIEIQRRIYELDPTYRLIMNDIIKFDIPDYRLKNHRLYPYLLEFFEDIGYDYDNAMYYYTDDQGQAQMSFIDDDFNHITDNFVPDGDTITYQGTDILYLLEGYMTPSDSDSDYMDSDGEYIND